MAAKEKIFCALYFSLTAETLLKPPVLKKSNKLIDFLIAISIIYFMKFRLLKPLTILSTLLIIFLCFTASASAFFVSSEKTHVWKNFFSDAFFTRNFSPLTADNTPDKNYDDKKIASDSLLVSKSEIKALEAICFTEETLISTKSGYKKIKDILVGDYVYSKNISSSDECLKKVVNTSVKETKVIVRIFIENENIRTTLEHPFYVKIKGWTAAKDLKSNDELILFSNISKPIKKIEIENLHDPIKVYNFEVEDWHTYFVGNEKILVHNSCSAGRFPKNTAEDIKKVLGVTKEEFHKPGGIKDLIKTQFSKELKEAGITNPDIGIDEVGNLLLKHPKNNKIINTNVPWKYFVDE